MNFSRAPGLGGSSLSADLVWFDAPGDETRRSERAASALAQSVSNDYWGEMSFADQEKVLRHMAGRAAQCRRLARSINDDRARNILLQMAEEIEADMGRLSAGEGSSDPGST